MLKCHAGCQMEEIVGATGHTVRDLFPPKVRDRMNQETSYSYCDESGMELYRVVRKPDKQFLHCRQENGETAWNMDGVRRLPYKLPEILAKPDHPVIVVEGEKDVECLFGMGLLGTCNSGGAGKWGHELSRSFKGRRMVVIPDRDTAGKDHAIQVIGSLLWHGAASVKLLVLPVAEKGDLSDWMQQGGTKEELIERIKKAKEWS